MTFPLSIFELSMISDLLTLAVTVESTIIVLTKSPTSAVSPPVEYIPTPWLFKSFIISSVPLIIEEITEPGIKFLFLPIV